VAALDATVIDVLGDLLDGSAAEEEAALAVAADVRGDFLVGDIFPLFVPAPSCLTIAGRFL
jgi:hypothetical protein